MFSLKYAKIYTLHENEIAVDKIAANFPKTTVDKSEKGRRPWELANHDGRRLCTECACDRLKISQNRLFPEWHDDLVSILSLECGKIIVTYIIYPTCPTIISIAVIVWANHVLFTFSKSLLIASKFWPWNFYLFHKTISGMAKLTHKTFLTSISFVFQT